MAEENFSRKERQLSVQLREMLEESIVDVPLNVLDENIKNVLFEDDRGNILTDEDINNLDMWELDELSIHILPCTNSRYPLPGMFGA